MDAAGQVGGRARDGVEGEGCTGRERSVGLDTREKVGESIGRDEDVLGGYLFLFGESCDCGGNASDNILVGELDNLDFPLVLHIRGAEYDYRRRFQVDLATVCRSGDFDNFVVHGGLDLGAWRRVEVKVLGARLNNIDELFEIHALYVFQWKLTGRRNEDIWSATFQEGIDRGAASRVERQDKESQVVECAGKAGDDIFNVIGEVNRDPFCVRDFVDMRAEGLNVLGQVVCWVVSLYCLWNR